MSYRVDGLGEPATFDAGTSVLLAGPSTLTDQRLLDAVAPREGERSILVTTNMESGRILEELADRGSTREQVGVIDCTGADPESQDASIRSLGSPGDLTGISLEFAKLLEGVDDGVAVRVGFASVSTALMYTELRTMFRFLHVFTARIRSGEMFGVFGMDPGMHEEQAHNTIRAVFDCEAAVSEGGTELLGSGFERL